MKIKILPRTFYERDTAQVARDLLGKKLVRILPSGFVLEGIISETEAYQSDDPACHAHRGKTIRNQSLFGEVGHAYVYLSYGLHYCLNLVSYNNKTVNAGGVLIRAVIPVAGIDYMRKQRHVPDSILTNGPGKLTQAFSITKQFDGIDLTRRQSEIYITDGYALEQSDILATKRIGLSIGTETLWRFVISPEMMQKIKQNL